MRPRASKLPSGVDRALPLLLGVAALGALYFALALATRSLGDRAGARRGASAPSLGREAEGSSGASASRERSPLPAAEMPRPAGEAPRSPAGRPSPQAQGGPPPAPRLAAIRTFKPAAPETVPGEDGEPGGASSRLAPGPHPASEDARIKVFGPSGVVQAPGEEGTASGRSSLAPAPPGASRRGEIRVEGRDGRAKEGGGGPGSSVLDAPR